MMKDMNGLSHHIDILIHRYLVQAYHMRANDIEIRPFTYCCDTFNTCSNPRRVTVSDTSVATKSFSLLPLLPIVYHYPIKFTSKPIIQSYFTLPPKSSIFHRIVLPEDILWLSFDSITDSGGSLFSRWPGGTVTNFIFETDFRQHHLSSLLSSFKKPTHMSLLYTYLPLETIWSRINVSWPVSSSFGILHVDL